MNRSPLVDPPAGASADCVAVREALSRGEAPSKEAAAHAERCPVCRARPEADGGAFDADAAFSSLGAALERERGPGARLREMKTSTRFLLSAAGALALLAGIAVLRPRSRIAPMPVTRVVLVVSVLSVLLAVTVRLVLRPLHAPPAPRRVVSASLVAGLAVPFAFAALSHHHGDPTPFVAALHCFLVGGALGGAFAGLLFAFDRGELSSRTTGFLAAAAGGLAANAALELHCSSTDPVHLVMGHATVGVALIALFAARSRRRA